LTTLLPDTKFLLYLYVLALPLHPEISPFVVPDRRHAIVIFGPKKGRHRSGGLRRLGTLPQRTKELARDAQTSNSMSFDIDVLLRAKAREREFVDRIRALLSKSLAHELDKNLIQNG
jgi:hypothetical protein